MFTGRGARGRTAALLVALAAGLVLTGCGGAGGGTSGTAVGGRPVAGPFAGGKAQAGQSSAGSPAPGARLPGLGGSSIGATFGRDLVVTVNLTLQVADVPTAISRVSALVQGAQGFVSGEQASFDPRRPRGDTAMLTVRVPIAGYHQVLADLGRLGRETQVQQTTTDVTATVVDMQSRLASLQASLTRLRTLMSRATTVGDVVAIESELTTRESDLEALQAQSRALNAQVQLATIVVQLVRPPAAGRPPVVRSTGFLAGLRTGWHALSVAAWTGLGVLGLLLPFAGAAVAVGLLVLAVRRMVAAHPLPRPSRRPQS